MYWTTKRIALLALCATALIANFHTANAATFEIVGGSPLSTGPTPLYGSSLPQNNVVSSPGAPATGAPVFDPTGPNVAADTPWVQGGQIFAANACCAPGPGVGTLTSISWIFLGSESGFDITFHSPGLADFTEGNQNNSAYSGGPPLDGGAVQFLGQTKFVVSGPISFSLTWTTGSIDNSASQPSTGPNLIFSYAFFEPNPDRLELTKSVSDIIVFALNDGGPDDNHDDFVGAAFISTIACESPGCIAPQAAATPIPAALPLFGSVLAGGLLLHRWRKRRSAMART